MARQACGIPFYHLLNDKKMTKTCNERDEFNRMISLFNIGSIVMVPNQLFLAHKYSSDRLL